MSKKLQKSLNSSPEAVLLCSGGMDSTTLAYLLRRKGIKFIPLFIDYGQHCVTTEYKTLRTVLPCEYRSKIVKLDISSVYKNSNSRLIKEADLWTDNVNPNDLYLPYRNLLLLSIGAAYAQSAGIGKIFAGFINSNHVKEIDCSTAFFERLGTIFKEYGSIQVELPFRNFTKFEVARLGIKLHVPIAVTFSCQVSAEMPCGACPNCVEKITALSLVAKS